MLSHDLTTLPLFTFAKHHSRYDKIVCHLPILKWVEEPSCWRHQMEAFSRLLAPCGGNSPVTGDFPHNGRRRGVFFFWCFFICAWTNNWVNNRNIGDLRRNCAHYDFTVILGEMLWIGVVFQAMSQGDMANRHHWIRSYYTHYSDAIMGPTASQITSLTIVTQPFIQAQIKENIKAPHHWPLCGELIGERWIPHTNGQ